MSTRTIDAVRKLEHPANLTEIRSILGLCNIFWRFVPKLARVSSRINKQVQKGQPLTFDGFPGEEIIASETLKAGLIEYSVPELPHLQGDYTVDSVACDKQISCILLQRRPDGTDRPIEY